MNFAVVGVWTLVGAFVLGGCSSTDASEGDISSLPDSCSLVSNTMTQDVVGAAAGESAPSTRDRISTCRWSHEDADASVGSADQPTPVRRTLSVTVTYFPPNESSGMSSAELAATTFRDMHKNAGQLGGKPVNDLGDEAYVDAGDRYAKVTFLHSNAYVVVAFDGVGRGPSGLVGLGAERLSADAIRVAQEVDQRL